MPANFAHHYRHRPSELLSLDKSPLLQKNIATANKASSAFLQLPAEIRSLILDYVFTTEPIRIRSSKITLAGPVYHKITVCDCIDTGPRLSTRVRVTRLVPVLHRCDTRSRPNSHHGPTSTKRSLSVLQVCRQIYHEAALKPFSQAIFIYDCLDVQRGDPAWGLTAFLNPLVPTQATAICHLRLFLKSRYLDPAVLFRLRGLRHLELHHRIVFENDVERILEDLPLRKWQQPEVSRLGLEPIRIKINLDLFGHKVPTSGDVDRLEAALEGMELRMLDIRS